MYLKVSNGEINNNVGLAKLQLFLNSVPELVQCICLLHTKFVNLEDGCNGKRETGQGSQGKLMEIGEFNAQTQINVCSSFIPLVFKMLHKTQK